ncbi:hypothetical protein BH23THE1_BH23THE1_18590 [soil metagenome]
MSFVSGRHINEILNCISVLSYRLVNFQEINSDTFPQYAEFEFSGPIADFEDALRLSMERNSTVDYVVTQDSQKENTFTLLKAGDLGQLSIYFCVFCVAFFNSEEEKYIHERAHYF